MELKFVAAAKPATVGVDVKRRQKLVERIDQQVAFARDIIAGKTKPRAAWPWMDAAGAWFTPIKYGRHQLELKKGMFSIQCKDLDEVEHALCTVRAMVLNGDFDDQLAKLSVEIRKRFEKS